MKETNLTRNERLFRLASRAGKGKPAWTGRMVRTDLSAARAKWIEEADSEEEKRRRLDCDFLSFCNHDGLYADFHSLRHLFITNLARAGVSLATAQTLARHADIRLTLGVYTHIELAEQTAAIASLPAPPAAATENQTEKTPQLRVYREEERDGQDSAA
jgi:integrase